MITLISGTNRLNSNTLRVTKQYAALLTQKGIPYQLLDMTQMEGDCYRPCAADDIHPALQSVVDQYIKPAEKLLILSPEYNGSFPGVLKALIDLTDIKDWRHKKACLVGVATGRAGNLRGLDHLTNILLHIGMNVLPNKLPISRVGTLLDGEGDLDAPTLKAAGAQIDQFLAF